MELDADLKFLLLQIIRRHAFNQPVDPKTLRIVGYLDVIKRPMDVGTVAQRLKRGLYGLMRDMLLEVSCSWPTPSDPPRHHSPGCLRVVEGGASLLSSRCIAAASAEVDADKLEQLKKELAIASLWPVPDALCGCSYAADAAMGSAAPLRSPAKSPQQQPRHVQGWSRLMSVSHFVYAVVFSTTPTGAN
jgi:hypothetical protein